MKMKQRLSMFAALLLPVLALSAYLLLTPKAAMASCPQGDCVYNGKCYGPNQCMLIPACGGNEIHMLARCLYGGNWQCGGCE